MKTIFVDYAQFKNLASTKGLLIQYADYGIRYDLFILEPGLSWEVSILKDSADGIDFENNYKATSNQSLVPRTSDGLPKVLSALAIDNIAMYVYGRQALITGTTTFIESNFTTIVSLQGMNVFVKGAEWGDSIDVEVGYTHPVTQEWVSLKSFGESVYMKDSANWERYEYINNAVSKIPANLKIRVRYTQVNTETTKKLIVHFVTHR